MTMLKTGVVFFFTLLFSTTAYATHPLITDDTGTQGKEKVQIEINSNFSREKEQKNGLSFQKTGSITDAALSYGVSDNIDLVVDMPLQWYTIKEEGMNSVNENGIGDMRVELKWRLFDSEESGMSLALKPALSIPTGSEMKGLGSGSFSGGVTMIATRKSRLGAQHCNLGYSSNRYGHEKNNQTARTNIWHASLSAELNVITNFRAVSDIGIETNTDKGSASHPLFLLGGVIYTVSENLDLDLGVKGDLNESKNDINLLVGVAARF